MEMLRIAQDNIANFDETPVYFALECNMTLNCRGDRTITVCKANSSQRCTAMIGVSGGGHKFPPFLVFKVINSRSGRIAVELQRVDDKQEQISCEGTFNDFHLSNFYAIQAKAWMDTQIMLVWIEKV
jgi:hypothetical protein